MRTQRLCLWFILGARGDDQRLRGWWRRRQFPARTGTRHQLWPERQRDDAIHLHRADLRLTPNNTGGAATHMAACWPFSDTPFAPPMNDIPKIIFSRQAIKDGTRVDRTTRARADAKADRIVERPGVTPTPAVLQSWAEPTVARGDLAQEVHPVVLGRGQPLFSGLHNPVDLRLISATRFGAGVVAAVYQRA